VADAVIEAEKTTGSPHARFEVLVKEHGFDDKVRSVYLAVEAWGKVVDQVRALRAGQMLCVEGKLARSKRTSKDTQADEEWYTTVQAWRVQAGAEEEPS
jgi:single-stranded DNA-binding protein